MNSVDRHECRDDRQAQQHHGGRACHARCAIERLEACAATLGATPLRQFITIVLPNLRQSLFSGLVMVAALSIGEFQVSNLIAGFRYRNYPMVLIRLPKVHPDELKRIFSNAWRKYAGKRLVESIAKKQEF